MAPRSEKANMQIKDERREQILFTALKLFIRRGFAATKINDIAQAAGISHGLLYNYFKSKDEIYTELVRIAVTSSGDTLEQIERLDIEALDKIRATAFGILDNIEKSEMTGYFFILMLQAMTSDSNPAAALEIMRDSMKPLDVLRRIVADGQKKGRIRQGDPLELAATFFSTIDGLVYFKVFGLIAKLPDPELLIRMFLP